MLKFGIKNYSKIETKKHIMKKLLLSLFALTLSFGVFAQQFYFGKVSFATDSVWIISGNGITQIWSDAVQTDRCSNKTSFDGGDKETSTYNVDCRSNPGQKGDLFSWRAMNEFKNELCPAPWRVPTEQDFIDLDIALGGAGTLYDPSFDGALNASLHWRYRNVWGASFSGFCSSDGSLSGQGSSANYWSQSDGNADYGIVLFFHTNGGPVQFTAGEKRMGFPLRCVRDN